MKTESNPKIGTSLPHVLPAPAPMELAKLAAILAPQSTPEKALQRAMEFYVEAVCFSKDLPPDWESIIGKYGTTEREFQWLQEHAPEQKRLKLEWRKNGEDADEVRQFLKANGLVVKLAKSVLNNFRHSWKLYGRNDADTFIAAWESTENGEKIYMIPERFIIGMANIARRKRSESKRKGWRTREK